MSLAGASPFKTLLIANRGEIAVRVIRCCAELGIRSVAVYSDADRDALHVRLADEARPIGPAPARESYLNVEAIIAAARASGADAIHPGYGFLAESAEFAEACAGAGLVFVGPTPAAMRLLGDKSAARRLAAQVGVPTVPGYDGADQADETFAREAGRIGYPLLVKAAGGGGGRGMRVVEAGGRLAEALASARREAGAAFGDETLLLERLVTDARHVEVQVLGDRYGSLIHLGERDCSVQRRHQKVIEESPAPGLSSALRSALGDAALAVARSARYSSAGTCEFLLDGNGTFWFIEMNARLQVEHPVTEAVTGLDLVRQQIEIAAGRPLGLRQADITARGHAIELRLYAEDAANGDAASTGRLERFQPPYGPGLRHDVGYAVGDTVSPHYDSMLAKLIAYGEDRDAAIRRARAALDAYVVAGVATNRALLAWILDHPAFRSGTFSTTLLERDRPRAVDAVPTTEAFAAAAVWIVAAQEAARQADPTQLGDWRIGGQGITLFLEAATAGASREHASGQFAVVANRDGPGLWQIVADGRTFEARVQSDVVTLAEAGDDARTALCPHPVPLTPQPPLPHAGAGGHGGADRPPAPAGRHFEGHPPGPTELPLPSADQHRPDDAENPADPTGLPLPRVRERGAEGGGLLARGAAFTVTSDGGALIVARGSSQQRVRRAAPPSAADAASRHATGGLSILAAPMPGRVVRVDVAPGDRVREHQALVVIEAMKIEHTIAAPRDGTVYAVTCQAGDAVATAQVLVELTSE